MGAPQKYEGAAGDAGAHMLGNGVGGLCLEDDAADVEVGHMRGVWQGLIQGAECLEQLELSGCGFCGGTGLLRGTEVAAARGLVCDGKGFGFLGEGRAELLSPALKLLRVLCPQGGCLALQP